MKRKSAGILLYRVKNGELEVFLVHPGGPYWQHKDAGAWTIPKGEFTNEDPFQCALREFKEETGTQLSATAFTELTPVLQKAGKQVWAWAAEGDLDAEHIRSNTYRVEWPYKSGQWKTFPEVDKAAWFTLEEAREKINPAQVRFLEELKEKVKQGAK